MEGGADGDAPVGRCRHVTSHVQPKGPWARCGQQGYTPL